MGFDLRPILFLAAMPVLLILAWLIRRFKFPATSYASIIGVTFLAFVVLFWFFLAGPFIGKTIYKTFPMNWSIVTQSAEESAAFAGETNVTLNFVADPNQGVGYYSSEIADSLRKNGKNPVDVTFEITADYGKVRGFDAMRIDNLILSIDSRNPLASRPGDSILKKAPAFSAAGVRIFSYRHEVMLQDPNRFRVDIRVDKKKRRAPWTRPTD